MGSPLQPGRRRLRLVRRPERLRRLLQEPGNRPGRYKILNMVDRVTTRSKPSEQGFTLLELMIVMVTIVLPAAIANPAYTSNIRNAKEAVLKEDLHVMRQAIDSYTVDKQKAPQSLDDLVQGGYLKVLPKDPFTERTDTWMTAQDDTLQTLDQTESGINDVHSGSQLTGSDGTSYSTW